MIDFNRIRQEKVRKLLRDNHISSRNDLSQLRSFCFDAADGQQYHKHIKSFLIKADLSTVWNAYKTIGPQETWRGTMISFGMMYSRRKNEILYPGDQYTGIEAGQIIFLNLNLFANIVNLAVGHEVTGVDEHAKTIKICYLQNGASTGTQLIQLKEKGPHTNVIHETWYRSGSLFRDKVLYPGFHEKGLTEFHENVKRAVESAA
jgi:hypothetical protein